MVIAGSKPPKNPDRVPPGLWFDVRGDPATPNEPRYGVVGTPPQKGAPAVAKTASKSGIYRNGEGHAIYLAEGAELLPAYDGYEYDEKATGARLGGRERQVGAAPDNRARSPEREAAAEDAAKARKAKDGDG